MTNETILRKALDKAEKGGFGLWRWNKLLTEEQKSESVYERFMRVHKFQLFGVIFSHDFAKAFWGEEYVCIICGYPPEYKDKIILCNGTCGGDVRVEIKGVKPAYKYHLQQMVLEEDKLKYLEKFLGGEK